MRSFLVISTIFKRENKKTPTRGARILSDFSFSEKNNNILQQTTLPQIAVLIWYRARLGGYRKTAAPEGAAVVKMMRLG